VSGKKVLHSSLGGVWFFTEEVVGPPQEGNTAGGKGGEKYVYFYVVENH